MSTRSRGFTLVELLVVIGIIALLISILLPSLNRARASANSLDCLSRLRQMGQAVLLYANDHKGFLPPGTVDGGFWGESHAPGIIGKQLAKKQWTGNRQYHTIFHDKDATPPTDSQEVMNHYNFHLRLFPVLFGWFTDPANNQPMKQRTLASVKRSSEVVTIYDGQPVDDGNAAWLSWNLSAAGNAGAWWWTGGFQRMPWISGEDMQLPIDKSITPGNVQFRHMNNSSGNVLFLDGHAEARKLGDLRIGEFLVDQRP